MSDSKDNQDQAEKQVENKSNLNNKKRSAEDDEEEQQEEVQKQQQEQQQQPSAQPDKAINKRVATGFHGSGDTLMLKVLIPNHTAGTIIGKKGSVIAEIQGQTGAKIVLSPSREYFPTTLDRVVSLQGSFSAVEAALKAVLDRLYEPPARQDVPYTPPNVKFAIPNGAAGMIIGQKGDIVRKIHDETGAKVQISSKNTEFSYTGERIVTILGTPEQSRDTAFRILHIINDNQEQFVYSNPTTSYVARRGDNFGSRNDNVGYPSFNNSAAYAPNGPGPAHHSPQRFPPSYQQQQPSQHAPHHSSNYLGQPPMQEEVLTVSVPDDLVGAILGRSGATIVELQRQSGASIKISPKGEFVPNTTDRIVVISGTPHATKNAHYLLSQRVQNAQHKRNAAAAAAKLG